DSTRLTISPATVTIPAGATVPATQPKVTGVNVGSASVTASAVGYQSASQSVNVIASVTFSPNTLVLSGNVTENLSLDLSGPAPAGGLIVNVSSDAPAVASTPATVTFASGATSTLVPITGVSVGAANIHASLLPSIPDTTAGVTVLPASTGSITLTNAVVGQNLQDGIMVSIPQPAPSGGQQVRITSGDPGQLLIAGRPNDAGAASLGIVIPETESGVFVYVQGLGKSGVVTVTATAIFSGQSTISSGQGTVTLMPSGFVLAPPGGIGTPSFSTYPTLTTQLTAS